MALNLLTMIKACYLQTRNSILWLLASWLFFLRGITREDASLDKWAYMSILYIAIMGIGCIICPARKGTKKKGEK